jgi:hypothetical protein
MRADEEACGTSVSAMLDAVVERFRSERPV